jgi:hypothetical protein
LIKSCCAGEKLPVPTEKEILNRLGLTFSNSADEDGGVANVVRIDLRHVTYEDTEVIRKLTAAFEKYLRMKNQQKRDVEDELKTVKEVVKRYPSLRIFVKRIGMNIPLEAIKVIFNLINCWFRNFIFFILGKISHSWSNSSSKSSTRSQFNF